MAYFIQMQLLMLLLGVTTTFGSKNEPVIYGFDDEDYDFGSGSGSGWDSGEGSGFGSSSVEENEKLDTLIEDVKEVKEDVKEVLEVVHHGDDDKHIKAYDKGDMKDVLKFVHARKSNKGVYINIL